MTKDFISIIILEMKNHNLMISNLFSFQGKWAIQNDRPLWPWTWNDLFFSNPINGLDLDSTSSIYQIFDRPEGQVLVCDICSQEFNDPKSIKQHKREAHRYQCDQCASNYTGNEHYFIHGMLFGFPQRISWDLRTARYTDRPCMNPWGCFCGVTYTFLRTNTFVKY